MRAAPPPRAMKRTTLCLLALLLSTPTVLAQRAQGGQSAPARFVVGLRASADVDEVLAGLGSAVDSIPGTNTHLVRLARGVGAGSLTDQLGADPDVLFFEVAQPVVSPEAEGCTVLGQGPGPQP